MTSFFFYTGGPGERDLAYGKEEENGGLLKRLSFGALARFFFFFLLRLYKLGLLVKRTCC